jgi:hypothetical protein
MKTLISFVAVSAFILMSSFTLDVQQNLNHQLTSNCFNYFRTHRQGKGVAMTWAAATNDVVEFVVERSYDGEYFEPAGTLSPNGASSFKFIDNDVFPGYVSYRVTAVKADGSTESSPVETVHIVQRH